MREIFLNRRGLRAGWRLLIFVALLSALSFASDWGSARLFHPSQRPFLDPLSFLEAEIVSLILVLLATWIMSRIERRPFEDYGIPSLDDIFGRHFWIGTLWGIASTSLLIGLIALFGGYHIVGLAIGGLDLLYFTALWLAASLLIGFAEELQFRAYLLATTADGIGFWPAAAILSLGFGALHFFFKPHERWEDFASTALLGLFMCLTLRRTGSLAFAIGFHAAFDFANLFLWSGQNAGEYAVGHLLQTNWQGSELITGGLLGPEASLLVFPVIALMFFIFDRLYCRTEFRLEDEGQPQEKPAQARTTTLGL